MTFQALLTDNVGTDQVETRVRRLSLDQLPAGNVTVAVEYSTINYKDGLCLRPKNGLVRAYPHVGGIDFSGSVESSDDPRFRPGDKVVLTGWRVGEIHWGGFSQKARVDADWLVPLPKGLTAKQAMAVGTAGFAAALAIVTLEDHGLQPNGGEVIVTGAAGGVGSMATTLLSRSGYSVAAVTGRPETAEYLKSLGAKRIVSRDKVLDVVNKSMESETWAGCVDAVGGSMLARILGQLKYGAPAAAVGLAGGAELPTSLIPFLLRGIKLLGIDSVMQPTEKRTRVWQRIARDLPIDQLEDIVQVATLKDVPDLCEDVLSGKIRGRVVVDVNA